MSLLQSTQLTGLELLSYLKDALTRLSIPLRGPRARLRKCYRIAGCLPAPLD